MNIKVNGIPYDVPTGSKVQDALELAGFPGTYQITVNGKPATLQTVLRDANRVEVESWSNVPDPYA